MRSTVNRSKVSYREIDRMRSLKSAFRCASTRRAKARATAMHRGKETLKTLLILDENP